MRVKVLAVRDLDARPRPLRAERSVPLVAMATGPGPDGAGRASHQSGRLAAGAASARNRSGRIIPAGTAPSWIAFLSERLPVGAPSQERLAAGSASRRGRSFALRG